MVTALLGGCVTPRGKTVYEKPGIAAQQKKKDESECVKAALDTAGQRGAAFIAVDRDAVDRCMREHGYTVTAPK